MSTVRVEKWNQEMVSLYLRTSQGRGRAEATGAQLFEVTEEWLPMVPRGAIARTTRKGYAAPARFKKIVKERTEPIDGKIVVYDEGVASGFVEDDQRPVLAQLIKDAADGKVTKVLVVSPDRLANDPILWGYEAHMLRRVGALVHDITTGLEVTPMAGEIDMAALTNNLMLEFAAGAAELSKRTQISKAAVGTRKAAKTGVCSGNLGHYLLKHDYRELYQQLTELRDFQDRIKPLSRHLKEKQYDAQRKADKPTSARDIGRNFGKVNKKGVVDNKWLGRWKKQFAKWAEAGVLDEWLDTVENIAELDSLVKVSDTGKEQVKAAMRNNSCFLTYPAGRMNAEGELEIWAPQDRTEILNYANT